MNNSVKKAVIPVAGLGTRFLPATKSVPKELFPIIDKPILLFIIEEAVRAGIEDIVLVAGRGKTAIEDFFDTSFELETRLAQSKKEEWLSELKRIKDLANIISIRQHEALGLGHAILASRPVIGQDPFAVLLGDELMINSPNEPSAIAQLVKVFDEKQVSVVATIDVPPTEVHKYGIIEYSEKTGNLFKVTSVVEKPHSENAPSTYALPGRYVFSSTLFSHLENLSSGVNGEIQLTDGMVRLAKTEGLYATEISTRRFDAGDKLGYLQANIELGLEHPEIGESLRKYLKKFASTL